MQVGRITIVLASVLALVSCKSDSTGPTSEPTVAGTWLGSFAVPSVTVTLLLSEGTDGSVAGDGTVVDRGSGSVPVSVVGSYAFPRIALILLGFDSGTLVYHATVAEDVMMGSVSGAGFNEEALALHRQ